MSIRFCILALVIMVVGTVPSSAGGSKDKDKHQNIIVTRFDIQDGVNFPPDYLVTMTDELVKELQGTKTFKQVLREGEQPDNKDVSTIKLLGTVTHFDKGSRAKRYLVGFGAGKTKVAAHIKFVDASNDAVLWENNVDGKVWIGFVGGDSIGATRGLAKEVAKKAKQQFF